jgi:DNA-binding XRE family transcriptional regulator
VKKRGKESRREKGHILPPAQSSSREHTADVPQSLKPHVIVGRNICRIRMEAMVTQEKLAELLDIDRRSIQRIESGRWNMTIDYLDRFRRALRCEWSDLLRGI